MLLLFFSVMRRFRNLAALSRRVPRMHRPDKTLDIQGIAGRRVRALAGETPGPMKPGEVLKLITTDKTAIDSIVALCREKGYALLEEALEDAHYAFLIQR